MLTPALRLRSIGPGCCLLLKDVLCSPSQLPGSTWERVVGITALLFVLKGKRAEEKQTRPAGFSRQCVRRRGKEGVCVCVLACADACGHRCVCLLKIRVAQWKDVITQAQAAAGTGQLGRAKAGAQACPWGQAKARFQNTGAQPGPLVMGWECGDGAPRVSPKLVAWPQRKRWAEQY